MGELLTTLAARVGGAVVGDGTLIIDDVVHDHRTCRPGAMFVAKRGLTRDGHDFVAEAGECSAVCVDHEMRGVATSQLIVSDTNVALGRLAAAVHGDPFTALRAVGITGTNGKTTVAWFLAAIARAAGMVPAALGTLGVIIGDERRAVERTSPEASELHREAAAMVAAGADIAAFEVSSHALRLGRIEGAHFAIGAFTNLSADHLDFHSDMEDYFSAKASLFAPPLTDQAVIWIDDPAGRRLAEEVAVPVVTVGSDGKVSISAVEPAAEGVSFSLTVDGATRRVALPLAGTFNVANAAVAAGCAWRLGVDLDAITEGLDAAPQVPGRFQRVAIDAPFQVFVDYAHTPDGIRTAIESAQALEPKRVLVVIGAGGDRDRMKRREMGRAAAAADVVVITNDNPRSEDPTAIAAAVAAGAPDAVTMLDRRLAIRHALSEAQPNDVVLVLGKGHEQGQDFGDRIEPFDDISVVMEEAAR